jgi:hypothetical protein
MLTLDLTYFIALSVFEILIRVIVLNILYRKAGQSIKKWRFDSKIGKKMIKITKFTVL